MHTNKKETRKDKGRPDEFLYTESLKARQKHAASTSRKTQTATRGKKKEDKRIEEGQGACLHLEKQKEKEQCYSKDVCLWQGHWVRPC